MRLQFLQDTLSVGNIGDYEPCRAREQRYCLNRVSAGRLVEVEEDRQVVTLAKFIP